MGKINVYDKIVIKKKKKNIWKFKKFIHTVNLHLKEDFRMEFTAC